MESAIVDLNKSSPSPSGKVCTVSSLSTTKGDYYAVLIVDLASPVDVGGGGYVSTAPTFLLDRNHLNQENYSFCVLGSFLYMFQKGPREGKSVYSVNLTDAVDHLQSKSENLVLDKSLIHPLPDMLCPKFHTVTIPTPDSKRILAFSRVLNYRDSKSIIDFELYHPPPSKSKGKSLPSPIHFLSPNPNNGHFAHKFRIESFTFISDSVFQIHIAGFGIFNLDIDADNPIWQKIDSFFGSISIPFISHYFVIRDHNLCIAGYNAYNIKEENLNVFDRQRASRLPQTSFHTDFKHGSRQFSEYHIVKGEKGELFGSVVFHTGIRKKNDYAHMLLDVYRFDLDKYRDDMQNKGADARLEASIIKTFKFVLDGYRCFDLISECCYPLLPNIPQDTE